MASAIFSGLHSHSDSRNCGMEDVVVEGNCISDMQANVGTSQAPSIDNQAPIASSSHSNSKSHGGSMDNIAVNGEAALDTEENVGTSQVSSIDNPAPIPLRTLITLLHYELCVSNPRFQDVDLLQSTSGNYSLLKYVPKALLKHLPAQAEHWLRDLPSTTKEVRIHEFTSAASTSRTPSSSSWTPAHLQPTIDKISPKAPRYAHRLSRWRKESIYYETRGLDASYKAAGIFQAFFDLCPVGQQVAVQLKDEPLVLLNPLAHTCTSYKIAGSKTSIMASGLRRTSPNDDGTAAHNSLTSRHAVLVLESPDTDYVIDMTRMQYGGAGRGQNKEPYWLGTADQFFEMNTKMFEDVHFDGTSMRHQWEPSEKETVRYVKDCAIRALTKWLNRDNEGWCNYCGVGASESSLTFRDCQGCKTKRVQYCSKEHLKWGWRVHRYTCEMSGMERMVARCRVRLSDGFNKCFHF